MELIFTHKYQDLSDKELVERIIAEPCDDEAAAYLIYNRYEPLCAAICARVLDGILDTNDLQAELFILLKGKNKDWHALKAFGWRSSLGRWLSITAYNLALELRRRMIENDGKITSIDKGWVDDDGHTRTIEIPNDDKEQQERRYNMIVLNEIIKQLKNSDQRFVVEHRLQGYSSKEVAQMLQVHWEAEGIVRYNKAKQIVHADSGYIDNLFKRGYDKVAAMYKTINR